MKSRRRAFTLLELIVVIGVVMVLVTLLVVALRKPRGRAQQAVCKNNLRDIAAAAINYSNLHKSYPAGYVDATTHWMDRIEDQIGKESKVYRCPADRQQLPVTDDPDGMILSYGINRFCFPITPPTPPLVDTDYSFWNGVKQYRVKRPAETIIFADCDPGLYYCGGGAVFSDPVPNVAYRHMGGSFCVAFCDGHTGHDLTVTVQKQWDASQ